MGLRIGKRRFSFHPISTNFGTRPELPAPCHKSFHRLLFAQDVEPQALVVLQGVVGDDCGVDGVGLCELACGLGVFSDAPGVDECHAEPGGDQAGKQELLAAAGGLEGNELGNVIAR